MQFLPHLRSSPRPNPDHPAESRRLKGLPALIAVTALVASVAATSVLLGNHSAAAQRAASSKSSGLTSHTTPCPSGQPITQFGGPKWCIASIGPQGFTSPVAGSINGVPVVVDASLTGWVYVVNAKTGWELPGWPRPVNLVGSTNTAVDSSPAIAYLDGPGRPPSIVVGAGSLYAKAQNGGVMAWNANGSVRFRFLTKKTFSEWGGVPNNYSNSVFATPAIGDVTGSGQQDIVFGSYDHYLYALNPSGHVLPGFPVNRADSIWSSPALVDTTHTGQVDIIEGGDSTGWRGPNGGTPCYNGWVSDYRYLFSAPRLIWEKCIGETVWSSPAVTTFGTTPVVVVGTSFFSGAGRTVQPAEDEVFAFNAKTGATMPGWPVSTPNASTFGSPAVGPLMANGANAVVTTSCASCSGPATVTAWSQNGHRLWQQSSFNPGSEILGSPAIAALGNSGTNDVLVGDVGGLWILNGKTGGIVDNSPINRSCFIGGTPVVMPVGGGAYELISNCGFQGSITTQTNSYLRAYNVPAPAKISPYPWPMFRANAQRTGVPDPNGATRVSCRAPTGSPTGYRLPAKAGGVLTYGKLGFCGSLIQQLVPGTVAGMASTPNGGGYWLALTNGAVYAFGNAGWYGDARESGPMAPIVGIAASRSGKGYLLLSGDGSVATFGDAVNHGSEGSYRANGTPVGVATDTKTGGYWIATSSGHVYGFDAPLASGKAPTARVVGIAAAHSGTGYWLVETTGGVANFGVPFVGSENGKKFAGSIVGIAGAQDDKGYYIASSNGNIYHFGSGPSNGSAAGHTNGDAIVGISVP